MKGEFNGITENDDVFYGVAEGLLKEIGQTWLTDGVGTKLLAALAGGLAGGTATVGTEYDVDVGKTPGFSDMETAIGKHKVSIKNITEKNGIVTVTIHAHDTFDFDAQGKGKRLGLNEFVTTLGRNAGIGSETTQIDVYYDLNFEKNGDTYVYIK